MIPPIEIDVSEIVESFSLSKSQTDELMRSTLDSIVNDFIGIWENNISKELKTSRAEYKRAIFVEKVDEFTTVVGLTTRGSKLPLMIEDGATPFDIKAGFEKSSKRKFNKDGGWYLTVPFRIATPSAIGESGAFSGVLPAKVHSIAKAKSRTSPGIGLKSKELPSQFRVKGIRETIGGGGGKLDAYQHKSSIYEGVAKRSFGTDSSYTSFRRVSSNSDANSWIHRGLTARKLMEKSLGELRIEDVVSAVTDQFLENI